MLRAERILWAMMLGSVCLFYVLVQVQPAGTQDGSTLNLIFPALAAMQVALSFIVPRLVSAGNGKDLANRRRTSLVMALAFCEAAALFGFVLHTLTGWPHAWTLFALSAVAMAAHFPREE